MRTTRRPFKALAIGAAALALALSSCSGDAADDSTATPVETSTAAAAEAEPTTAGEGRSEGYAPVGEFPVLSLAPMATDDAPSSEVAPDRLAEIAAGVAGAEPTDVTCEGTLQGGSGTSVSCTLSSTQDVVTAYPVLSGPAGTEDHSLVVAGELSRAQAEMVMDPEVSAHYGPTSLFFDDPALLEQDGLVERVQAELESLGVSDTLETCEGIVGGSTGHSGVRCTGTQDDSPAPFEAQLYPTLSASGDPVSFALIHRPLQ
ncbi:hypothetical protein GCM10023160_04370 [Brachybacterium paraconglomeratum]|uniref:hypothetical protein n=1 Tax=Brachybacterium paraconglomeratum TaxID=173362 RepID=UPI0031F0323C